MNPWSVNVAFVVRLHGRRRIPYGCGKIGLLMEVVKLDQRNEWCFEALSNAATTLLSSRIQQLNDWASRNVQRALRV